MDERDPDCPETDITFSEDLKFLTLRLADHDATSVDTQTTVRNVLKLLKRKFSEQHISKAWKNEAKNVLPDVVSQLLNLITNKDCLVETALLAGTCFAFIAFYTLGPVGGASFVVLAMDNFSEDLPSQNFSDKETEIQNFSDDSDYSHQNCKLKKNQYSINCNSQNNKISLKRIKETYISFYDVMLHDKQTSSMKIIKDIKEIQPCFVNLVLIHGLISCRKVEILIQHVEIEHTILFKQLFYPIYKLCLCTIGFQFQAFQLLLSWLKLAGEILPTLHSEFICENVKESSQKAIFSCSSDVVNNILHLVDVNWENPVHGVPEIVKNIYTVLVEVHEKENKVLCNSDNLLEDLISKTMNLSWKVKGKYIALSCLIPYIGYQEILENNSSIPSLLIQNFSASYIVSTATQVYINLIQNMLTKHTNGDVTEIWAKWWLKPLAKALLCSDKNIQHNAVTHLLPWTLKNIPQSFAKLFEEIKCSEDHCHLAEVSLFQAARQAGICSMWHLDLSAIRKTLHHKDEDVRMELLTLICSSPKKAEAPTEVEVDLIKDFLVMNLNIDSAPFRNHFIIQMKNFLVRVRDSSLRALLISVKKKESLPSYYKYNTDFVDWLVKVLLKNLFPGACYQRRCSSLHLLTAVFECFFSSPQQNKRKGAIPERTCLLVKQMQDQGKWDFFSNKNKMRIFCCIMDSMDEIRLTATEILETYFPWTIFPPNCNDVFSNETLTRYASTLCNSPHPQNCNAGALIFRIIFKKYIFENGLQVNSNNHVDNCEIESSLLCYLKKMTLEISAQLQLAKLDLLSASSKNPVHGCILALHHCLTECYEPLLLLCDQKPFELSCFFEDLILICEDIVEHMLCFLASKSGTNESAAPSFEEMGQAVEDIINFALNDREDTCSLSLEFQLVLSCCWLCLKESCLLLSDLVICVLSGRPSSKVLEYEQISRIGRIMTSILYRCRHKGAIEACGLSLGKFCKQLLHSKNKKLQEIPEIILNELFFSLQSTSSSVTRRSAGLPLLVLSVVTGEPSVQNHKILEHAFSQLLGIATLPLPYCQNEKIDLPQTHAFHILKAIVVNSTLSTSVLSWLDKIVPICINGFSSSSWAIRNGALQLFGSVVPRLIGQRKVKEEGSLHNTATPIDLFIHYPSLHMYFKAQLSDMATKHLQGELCLGLIPLLSLLVHLAPAGGSEKVSWTLLEEFLPFLQCLLKSPLYSIRTLSASILSSFIPPVKNEDNLLAIISLLPNKHDINIQYNTVHGWLLLIERILDAREKQFFSSERRSLIKIWDIFLQHSWLATFLNPCLFVRSIYLKIVISLLLKVKETSKNIEHLKMLFLSDNEAISKWKPGYMSWKRQQLLFHLINIKASELSSLVNDVMFDYRYQSCSEECLLFLSVQLQRNGVQFVKNLEISNEHWQSILEIVLKSLQLHQYPPLLQMKLELIISLAMHPVLSFPLNETVNSENLEYLKMLTATACQGITVASLALLLWSLWLRDMIVANKQRLCKDLISHIEEWVFSVYSNSQPQRFEVSRHQAAISLTVGGATSLHYILFAKQYSTQASSSYELIFRLYEAALTLLQDEDEKIRKEASSFVYNLYSSFKSCSNSVMVSSIQSSMAIVVLCDWLVHNVDSTEVLLDYLWSQLLVSPFITSTQKFQKSLSTPNLFRQEDINIYSEPYCILLHYKKHLKEAFQKLLLEKPSVWLLMLEIYVAQLEVNLKDTELLSDEVHEDEINGLPWLKSAIHPKVFLAVAKMNCQISVLTAQIPHLPSSSYSIKTSFEQFNKDFFNIQKKWEFDTIL